MEKRWGWVREERESYQGIFSPHRFYNSSEDGLWSYISITADSTESKPKRECRRESEEKGTWEEAQDTKISAFDNSNLVKNYISPAKFPNSSSPQSPNSPLPSHLFSHFSFSIYGCLSFFPFLVPLSPFQFSPSQCVFFSRPTSEFAQLTLCAVQNILFRVGDTWPKPEVAPCKLLIFRAALFVFFWTSSEE